MREIERRVYLPNRLASTLGTTKTSNLIDVSRAEYLLLDILNDYPIREDVVVGF